MHHPDTSRQGLAGLPSKHCPSRACIHGAERLRRGVEGVLPCCLALPRPCPAHHPVMDWPLACLSRCPNPKETLVGVSSRLVSVGSWQLGAPIPEFLSLRPPSQSPFLSFHTPTSSHRRLFFLSTLVTVLLWTNTWSSFLGCVDTANQLISRTSVPNSDCRRRRQQTCAPSLQWPFWLLAWPQPPSQASPTPSIPS